MLSSTTLICIRFIMLFYVIILIKNDGILELLSNDNFFNAVKPPH